MPMYSYICPRGHENEGFYHMAEAPVSVTCAVCETEAFRDYSKITFAPTATTGPQYSEAYGIADPALAPMYITEAKKHGLSIDFTKDGTAVFPDERSKRKYMRAHGDDYRGHVKGQEL